MHRAKLLTMLNSYAASHPGESVLVSDFLGFVENEPRCFERDCWTGHVTGSAWLLDTSQRAVLLTRHKKLGKWLQLGGHSDGDSDTLLVAVREAEEESGLTVEPLSEIPFDVDIHPIPARGSEPRHFHFDVRFLLRTVSGDEFQVSDESHALAWARLDNLQNFTDEPSILRMARKWELLSGSRAV